MTTLHPPDNNVRNLVTIQIAHRQLPPDPRFAVGEVRNPVDPLFGPLQLEPVDHRPRIPHRAPVVMRPVGLTGNNVLQPVAIHVMQGERMQFSEQHPIRVVIRLLSHDQVLLELDLIPLGNLFVPGESKSMRL